MNTNDRNGLSASPEILHQRLKTTKTLIIDDHGEKFQIVVYSLKIKIWSNDLIALGDRTSTSSFQ